MKNVRTMMLVSLWIVGCSPAPMPISSAANDPSNPHASEGVAPPAPASTDATPSAASDSGVAETYVCPMHPEVTAPGPARCSKCGMNLVPKK